MIIEQHRREWPEADMRNLAVIGRLLRATRVIDRLMRTAMAAEGFEMWEFDVLGALRRVPPPHVLTAGALGRQMVLSPGALTNRVDRLVARGLVSRDVDPGNRRQVLIGLTDGGHQTAGRLLQVVERRYDELLAGLPVPEQERLAGTLRTLLLSLGDRAPADGPPPAPKDPPAAAPVPG
ncbi:MAG TPA: MarR family transcriptional regulator [Pilimelia sp.]|nr:MarR family transcriptional regulator [Pilimelia sp.]